MSKQVEVDRVNRDAEETDRSPDDRRTDLLTDKEFERNCMHYADWAFYTPPEQFLFHHYDEPASKLLICYRPQGFPGLEKYVVTDEQGGHYGIYDTRNVTRYLKEGTWIEVQKPGFFEAIGVRRLERELAAQRERLSAATQGATNAAE